MRKRDKLYLLVIYLNNFLIKVLYRKQCNKVVDMFWLLYFDYVNNEIGGSLDFNLKWFWNYVKFCRFEFIEVLIFQSNNNFYVFSKDKV